MGYRAEVRRAGSEDTPADIDGAQCADLGLGWHRIDAQAAAGYQRDFAVK